MLAKQYHFPYDAIKALRTVQENRNKKAKCPLCIEGMEYPFNNIEILIEYIMNMKSHMKGELDKRPRYVIEDKGKMREIIKHINAEYFKDLRIRIITENGYKEYFYYDLHKGEFSFDLTSLKKIGQLNNHLYRLNAFQYNGEEIDLADICPEYWKGNWSMLKSSL